VTTRNKSGTKISDFNLDTTSLFRQ